MIVFDAGMGAEPQTSSEMWADDRCLVTETCLLRKTGGGQVTNDTLHHT